jgi:NADPH:quinone reductase-like Zn-dependent oxidoreductase
MVAAPQDGGVEVIGTASRTQSQQYVLDRGAHRVVDHHADLAEQLPDGVDYVFTPYSAGLVDTFATIVRPFGAIVAIDETAGQDLVALKSKSVAWHWELMFTRPLYDPLSTAQHEILKQVAGLVDNGITAANLRTAHASQESGSVIGKTVLAGF